MNHWILKTEPSTYSYADLEQAGTAVWDGVKNNLALKHLRAMAAGDRAIIYHSGEVRAAVGLAEITKAAYPDPQGREPKFVVVELRAAGALNKPVLLSAIRKDAPLTDLGLVRMPRLSVMPCSEAQYRRLVEMGA